MPLIHRQVFHGLGFGYRSLTGPAGQDELRRRLPPSHLGIVQIAGPAHPVGQGVGCPPVAVGPGTEDHNGIRVIGPIAIVAQPEAKHLHQWKQHRASRQAHDRRPQAP